jgi:hypothetical protein
MKIRSIEATVRHCQSDRSETKTLSFLMTRRSDQYTLVKVYCLELERSVVLDKEENLVLLPD